MGSEGSGGRVGDAAGPGAVGAISFLSRATTGADIRPIYAAIMSDRRICQF